MSRVENVQGDFRRDELARHGRPAERAFKLTESPASRQIKSFPPIRGPLLRQKEGSRQPLARWKIVYIFNSSSHTAAKMRASRLCRLPITVRPTGSDVAIARAIARETGPVSDEIGRALAWVADEKVLLVLAAIGWLASRRRGKPLQQAGNHALLVTIAASLLPHGLKILFNQTRPDRTTVIGHVHGISFSGKREDAFPSGHALHMGALASAAGALPTGPRRTIRALAVGLSLTRIAVLAHWASDVVTGFALGAVLERVLRLWTGYPLELSKEDDYADP
jgi:membrane-associated phospholipid phosphatase